MQGGGGASIYYIILLNGVYRLYFLHKHNTRLAIVGVTRGKLSSKQKKKSEGNRPVGFNSPTPEKPISQITLHCDTK